jgi:hypothetical protein
MNLVRHDDAQRETKGKARLGNLKLSDGLAV